MKIWIKSRVVGKKQWTATLFSLQLDAALRDFNAGQFIQVALDIDNERVGRSYSLVNAPHARPLEIYFNEVPEGPLTPCLSVLELGDQVWVSEKASGLFTLDKVPDSRSLWLFATGTALGVYLSILDTDTPWQRFEKVILVYGCRTVEELTYGERTQDYLNRHGDQFSFFPVVSRERRADRRIDTDSSHVMLCGNAAMIKDMRALLESRGLRRNSAKTPGHYTTEQYY
jgi:ferredoxin--NADP+ reductase